MIRHLFVATLLGAALTVPSTVRAEEASLHDFDVVFHDQTGAKTTFAKLDGQPVLVTMFYGNCAYACPMLVSRMRRLESKVAPEHRSKLRMVLVTFDPKRDTVQALSKLHEAYGLDDRWHFLRVDDAEAVQELAALLGVKYRFMPEGTINHSSVITLLDRSGVVQARMDGMDLPDDTILLPLAPLLAQ